MFLNINHQLESIATSTRSSEGTENTRNAKFFMKKILGRGKAFMFVAAVALTFFMMNTDKAQAQSRGYWATDGCYYQVYGNQWQRVECRYYDSSGVLVARNGNGTFYWYNGAWITSADYNNMRAMANLINVLGNGRKRSNAANGRLINRSNVSTSNNLQLINNNHQQQANMRAAGRP